MPPQRHLSKSSGPKERQRSAKACAPCRKRKIKCDGHHPCAACTSYNYDCMFIDILPAKESLALKDPAVKNSLAPANKEVGNQSMLAVRQEKTDGDFIASESIVQCHGEKRLLNMAIKTRFTSTSSAIAFPRSLGISLGITPPRLQSFGWNTGTRPESTPPEMNSICDIITLDEMKIYSGVFFDEIHPYFGVLDRNLYMAGATAFWLAGEQGMDFEAVMCVAVALGSLFSSTPNESVEAELMEHGRLLLDLSTSHAPTLLSMKHVIAWTLRVIYLRCTTRPHLSWLASCNALHTAEAIGLHREFSILKCNAVRQVPDLEIEVRRKDFWVASAFNQFLSCEYGRTRVAIESISLLPLVDREGDYTAQVVKIMQSVPKKQDATYSSQEMLDNLKIAAEMSAGTPFLTLLKADACFCTFRMLRSTNMNLPATQVTSLLEVIRVALDGAKCLATSKHPWWNVVYTTFQSICVLLSLATSESFTMIPDALDTLKTITTVFDSHLSREALSTASTLVKGVLEKKRKEVDSLNQGLKILGDHSLSALPLADTDFNFGYGGDIEWLMDGDMGYGDLFDRNILYGTMP